MSHESYSSLENYDGFEGARWPDDSQLGHLAEEALELARCEKLGDGGPLIRRYVVWDDVYQQF